MSIKEKGIDKLVRTQQQRMQQKYTNNNETAIVLEKAKQRTFYLKIVHQTVYVGI